MHSYDSDSDSSVPWTPAGASNGLRPQASGLYIDAYANIENKSMKKKVHGPYSGSSVYDSKAAFSSISFRCFCPSSVVASMISSSKLKMLA